MGALGACGAWPAPVAALLPRGTLVAPVPGFSSLGRFAPAACILALDTAGTRQTAEGVNLLATGVDEVPKFGVNEELGALA